MFSRKVSLFSLTLLLVLALAGCATELPPLPALPSAAEAQAAICNSLTTVNNSLNFLSSVDASTTVADIKALKASIDTGVQAIKAANSVLNRPTITEMTNAYDNLALQISGLPDGAALSESARANIQSGSASVSAALTQARSTLSCP